LEHRRLRISVVTDGGNGFAARDRNVTTRKIDAAKTPLAVAEVSADAD
jgi:hypothetical protein